MVPPTSPALGATLHASCAQYIYKAKSLTFEDDDSPPKCKQVGMGLLEAVMLKVRHFEAVNESYVVDRMLWYLYYEGRESE